MCTLAGSVSIIHFVSLDGFTYAIVSVINIKPEYAENLIGTGYITDPYVIE